MILGIFLHLIQDIQAHRAKFTPNMIFANNDIAKRREKINIVKSKGSSAKFVNEKRTLETCRTIVADWEVKL